MQLYHITSTIAFNIIMPIIDTVRYRMVIKNNNNSFHDDNNSEKMGNIVIRVTLCFLVSIIFLTNKN